MVLLATVQGWPGIGGVAVDMAVRVRPLGSAPSELCDNFGRVLLAAWPLGGTRQTLQWLPWCKGRSPCIAELGDGLVGGQVLAPKSRMGRGEHGRLQGVRGQCGSVVEQ